jgi:hypothetical protein
MEEQKTTPKTDKKDEVIRKIIIEVSEDNINLSKDSQHASVFELLAVLNTLVQSYNIKKDS